MNTCIYFFLLSIFVFFLVIYLKEYKNHMIHKSKNVTMKVINQTNHLVNNHLWEKSNTNLMNSNKNFYAFIYEKAGLNKIDTFTILDIDCGYSKQDFQWIKKLSNDSSIIGVDISKKQISYANKKIRKRNIDKTRLQFIECHSHYLKSQFLNKKFNVIISLDSVFQYKDRELFLRNVVELLTANGSFIISDIVLKEKYEKVTYYCSKLCKKDFIQYCSDFLYIPKKNLITLKKWQSEMYFSGFEILSFYDITNESFAPYKHFFENYIRNKEITLSTLFAYSVFQLLNTLQPFTYFVAICKKR